jgi:hypothetical protein
VSFNHLNYQLRPELPESHESLIRWVKELDPLAAPVQVEGAAAVAVCLTQLDRTYMLHLVNYANSTPTGPIRLHLAADIAANRRLTLISPDTAHPQPVRASSDQASALAIELASLDTYSILLMSESSKEEPQP